MPTLIPHPPRKFFIGNLHQVVGKDTVAKMIQLGYDYPTPVLDVKILNFSLVFVLKARIAQELLCQPELFQKHIDEPIRHLREVTGDGLFTAYNDEPNWQKAHNILTPGFAQRSIRGYVPAMKKICDQLLDSWEKVPEGNYINLTECMTKVTLETIGICGFNYSFGCFEQSESHPFIRAMRFTLGEIITRARTPPFLLPFRFRANALYKKHLTYTNQLIDDIIQKRKADPESNASNFDLLSLMLNAKDKETSSKLSDENIRYQIYTFLAAGHETTSGLLSFAFYLLMQHPDWLAKVYEEIDGVWGVNENQTISHRDLAKFPIIKQVLLETLRLYPPAASISVSPKEDITIGEENYPIKANQSCLVWSYHIHRDPEVWGENAEQFNPDHFTPANISKRDKYAFLAFGNGKRACIGRQFALTEATLVVATVLHRYKLELDPDFKFELAETITMRPKELRIRLKKRSPEERYHLKPIVPKAKKTAITKHQNSAHNTPFLILYGSNMGSSEDFALKILQDAQAQGFTATIAPLDEYVGKLPKEGFVQIVASTYNGTPPDNAKVFNQWLSKEAPDLQGVRYSVFGCGNTQWDTYQVFPSFIDRSIKRLGGHRFYPKGAADVSAEFEKEFQQWYQSYWTTILQQLNIKKQGWKILSSTTTAPKILTPAYQNKPALVQAILQHFQFTATTSVQQDDQAPVALGDWLSHQIDLNTTASPSQLEALIAATACPPDKMKLQTYLNQYATVIEAPSKTVFDLLQEFKACELTMEEFLALY